MGQVDTAQGSSTSPTFLLNITNTQGLDQTGLHTCKYLQGRDINSCNHSHDSSTTIMVRIQGGVCLSGPSGSGHNIQFILVVVKANDCFANVSGLYCAVKPENTCNSM